MRKFFIEILLKKIKKNIYLTCGLNLPINYYLDSPCWGVDDRDGTVKKLDIYCDYKNIEIPAFYNKEEKYVYSFPRRYIYKILNATIDVLDNLVYDYQGKLIAESSAWEYQRLLYEISKPFIKVPKRILKGNYIFLPTITNYYHWLIEDLPVFLASWKYSQQNNLDYKIIIGKDFNFRPIKNFIDNFLKKEKKIYLKDKNVRVENLIMTAKTGGMGNPFAPANTAHQMDIKNLREFFLNVVPIDYEEKNVKIYLSRTKFRRKLPGEELLEKRLKEEGFKIFYGNMSLFEQINLFRNASVIIGAQGAAMTNIIWCNSNIKVIDLHLPKKIFPFFYNITKIRGGEYKFLEIPQEGFTEKNINKFINTLKSYYE